MKKSCSHSIGRVDKKLRIKYTVKCTRKVVAKVSYKSCIDGKVIKEQVCKTHLNSLIKFAERVLRRTGYDVELKINDEFCTKVSN